MKIIFFAAALAVLSSCTKKAPDSTKPDLASVTEVCTKTPSTCGDVDIDQPGAQQAYEKGCVAHDPQSCYRLGQYLETKANNLPDAVKYYTQSCEGKYQQGCEDEKELRSKLCYLDHQGQFCKGEPEGEYRIYAFLEKFDPKFENAFVDHDFSKGFAIPEVKKLYESRLQEKSKALLKALRLAMKNGHHDGDDAETLKSEIRKIQH